MKSDKKLNTVNIGEEVELKTVYENDEACALQTFKSKEYNAGYALGLGLQTSG